MRVGVFSDSHGDHEALDELLERMGALDAVCFLGDVARDAEHLRERLAAMPNQPVLYAVRGNNDYYSTCTLPWDLLIELGGVRILMLHGHTRGVKSDVMRAVWAARECGAQVLLFGHTHRPLVDNDGSLLVLNPGAAGDPLRPTCGLLTIENGKADVRTLNL